jgi:hydroxyacylglutathione hydrolase
VEVLPGAYSVSVCGRSLSGKPTSTIGFERRFNKAFQIDDVAESITYMLQNIPAPPPEAASIRAANLGIV